MRVWALLPALALVTASLSAQESAPLPDPETFFAKARERLASNEALQNRYAFKERRTDLKLNPFGRIGSGPILVFEVYPSVDPSMVYRRLIERDGKPVPAAELAAQDEAYKQKYERWRQELLREDADERRAREKKRAEVEAKLRAQAREVLDLFTFTIDRRETWEGQPAIVVRFAAKPGAQPGSREGRVAVAFSGEAWLHETEYEVMHLKAHTIDDVSFGFGMVARLHEGAKTSLSRERVGSAWLPAATEFTGTGRALLFRRVTINYAREYFDYRRYDPNHPPPIAGLPGTGSR